MAEVDQRERTPCRPRQRGFQIEPQTVENRGNDVGGNDRTFGRHTTDRIAGTDHLAPFHPAPCEVDRKALWPVIASTRRVNPRRATELGEVADHRRIEQSPLAQILDECGVRLVVHRADDVLHAGDRREGLRAVNVPR